MVASTLGHILLFSSTSVPKEFSYRCLSTSENPETPPMNVHFLKKAAWRSLQALLFNLAGVCLLVMFYEDTPSYFKFSPHILVVLGLIARHKASIQGIMEIKKKMRVSELNDLQDQLRKNIAGIAIIAGMMCPLEIIRVFGRLSRHEAVGLDYIVNIVFSGLLLMFGILWYYSIGSDRREE